MGLLYFLTIPAGLGCLPSSSDVVVEQSADDSTVELESLGKLVGIWVVPHILGTGDVEGVVGEDAADELGDALGREDSSQRDEQLGEVASNVSRRARGNDVLHVELELRHVLWDVKLSDNSSVGVELEKKGLHGVEALSAGGGLEGETNDEVKGGGTEGDLIDLGLAVLGALGNAEALSLGKGVVPGLLGVPHVVLSPLDVVVDALGLVSLHQVILGVVPVLWLVLVEGVLHCLPVEGGGDSCKHAGGNDGSHGSFSNNYNLFA